MPSDKINTSTPPDSSTASSAHQPKKEEEVKVAEVEAEVAPPKRAQRTRNPVVLLQHNYYEIYDDKNNRAGKRKVKSSSKDSEADNNTGNNNENNSNSSGNQPKKRRTGSIHVGTVKKSSKTTISTQNDTQSTFRWVGSPIPPQKSASTTTKSQSISEDHTNVSSKNNHTYYEKVELNVGDHPSLVGIGDFVLVSSSDYQDEELIDKKKINNVQHSNITKQDNIKSRAAKNESGSAAAGDHSDDDDDDDEILNATLESEEKMEVAMNSLDPYIGKVEEMWEETKSKRKDDDDPYSNMKVRVRWFYKRGDVLSLKGQFVGIARQQLAASMSPRDILLGEQSDVNEISTILGKCRVIRLKPLKDDGSTSPTPSSKKDDKDKLSSSSSTLMKGAFFCRYNISIEPPTRSSRKGKIIITPYEGPDEEDEEEDPPSPQGSNLEATVASSDNGSVEGMGVSKPTETAANDDSSIGMADRRNRNQPPITEGSGTLKIKVGSGHQAVIPPQVNKRRYIARRKSPLLVWKKQGITDAKLNAYFLDAQNVLKDHMKKKGIPTTRSLPHNVPPGISSKDPTVRSSSQCAFREFNVDDLLYLLHDHNYNTVTALRGLKNFPEDYLFIWTKEDKELYNAGFQKHASNLHLTGKNVKETKNHKEVVDYHYRFKIPDQFKRYQDLKREQARRMLEVGENLRLSEYLSEGSNQGNGATNGMKKSQQWSTNVGGPDEIGELEARRLECKAFLFEVREAVGTKDYLTVVNLLKSLNAKVLSIPEMNEGFTSVLQKHPNLLKKFNAYLPVMFRS